jgi:hypothetical protein
MLHVIRSQGPADYEARRGLRRRSIRHEGNISKAGCAALSLSRNYLPSASHNKYSQRIFRILETTLSLCDSQLLSIPLIYQSIPRDAARRVVSACRDDTDVILPCPCRTWTGRAGST